MKRQEFEKKITEKLLQVRELSEKFFADNPKYDVTGDGYVAIAVYRDCVCCHTSALREGYIQVFKGIKAYQKEASNEKTRV